MLLPKLLVGKSIALPFAYAKTSFSPPITSWPSVASFGWLMDLPLPLSFSPFEPLPEEVGWEGGAAVLAPLES